MDFQHDQSWQCLESIIDSKLSVSEAWNRFIDFHENISPKPYWSELRQFDVAKEQADIVDWLKNLASQHPIPNSIIAIWIGIMKYESEGNEIPVIYFSGSQKYSADDASWASDHSYLPDLAFVQLGVLQIIDEIKQSDEENFEFIDWIFPIAYCALTFDEIFRTKISKADLFSTDNSIFITVGHNNGDYISISEIK